MKFLYDFFPVLLFFLAYKLYVRISEGIIELINHLPLLDLTAGLSSDAILFATAVAIFSSLLQVSLFWLVKRRFDKSHVLTLVIITVAGGATLALRDPLFFMWKPTILNGLFALVFLGSHFIGRKTITERMMGHAIELPGEIWNRLNLAWVLFFVIGALANLYVAYNFREEVWVNFKLFGLLGLTVLFILGQSLYLARYMRTTSKDQNHQEN